MSGINYRAELNDALNTIQTLRDQLHSTQDELKVTNSELMQMTLEMDKRIAKRTEELEEINQHLKREIEDRKQIETKLTWASPTTQFFKECRQSSMLEFFC